jgi:ABC-2 type transport system permease protein
MNNVAQAIWVELLKARRSRVPLLTALGFSLFPLAGGFFMIILKDPEFARRVGLISAKAQLTMGAADWPTYLQFLTLTTAMGGLVLFSLIGGWVFGREFSDRTVKDLLALPTSRSAIVLAKFVVVMLWSAALAAIIFPIGLAVGAAIGLPPVPTQFIVHSGVTLAITAILTFAVVTPIIFFASAGHGYLPPMGVALLAIFLAQIVGMIGWGDYFPWSIPGMYADLAMKQGASLGAVSYGIVVVTSLVGMAGTFIWWELADQTH